eukprot:4588714-Prymnesium_polylepis.1
MKIAAVGAASASGSAQLSCAAAMVSSWRGLITWSLPSLPVPPGPCPTTFQSTSPLHPLLFPMRTRCGIRVMSRVICRGQPSVIGARWRLSVRSVMLRILLILLACSNALAIKPSLSRHRNLRCRLHRCRSACRSCSTALRSALADVLHYGPYQPGARPMHHHPTLVVAMLGIACLVVLLAVALFKHLSQCVIDFAAVGFQWVIE